MKAGWQRKTLGEVCIVDKRQGIYKGLPYIGLEHIESHTGRFIGSTEPVTVKSSTFRFSPEHLLYGRLRPYLNKVMLPDFTGHCSTEIFPLKPHPELMREFLQYWFLMDATVEQIDATSTGARMPRANMNAVLDFTFLLPPLPEQQRIVAILDEAFDSIAIAKANAEKNLQNARTLFESYLQTVFSQRGEGWEEKKLSDVAENISTGPFGTMLHKSDYIPDGIPLVNPMNIVDSRIVPSSKMMVNEETRDRLRGYVLKAGDIVIARRGELGRCALVTEQEEGWLCGTGSFFVRLSDCMDGKFFVALFGSPQFKTLLDSNAVGTTMSSLNHSILNDLPILVPPIEVQRAIMAKADELLLETQRLESIYQQKLAALDELKKSLLHQAFNGDL